MVLQSLGCTKSPGHISLKSIMTCSWDTTTYNPEKPLKWPSQSPDPNLTERQWKISNQRTLRHHHQNTKWGNIKSKSGAHPSSRVTETCAINIIQHWSCSGIWWLSLLFLFNLSSICRCKHNINVYFTLLTLLNLKSYYLQPKILSLFNCKIPLCSKLDCSMICLLLQRWMTDRQLDEGMESSTITFWNRWKGRQIFASLSLRFFRCSTDWNITDIHPDTFELMRAH